MKREQETGMAVITAVVIILLMAIICFLCGCTTKQKVITEYVAVHDTIQTHHTDTIRDVRVVTLTDTVKYVERHELTVNNAGDTIKEIHHYYDRQTTTYVDSTYRYKAERDSLDKALHEMKQREKTVVKKQAPQWIWIVVAGNLLLFTLLFRRIIAIFVAKIRIKEKNEKKE